MTRKRKLTNLSERCRFCLTRDACMSDLFVDWVRPKIDDLQKCSSIEILDKPNYPKSVCYVCLYKLEMWSEFKLQFIKSNKTLDTHFKIVDPLVNETDKVLTETTADEIFSDDYKKRQKFSNDKIMVDEKTLELVPNHIIKSSTANSTDDLDREITLCNQKDESNVSSVNKSQSLDGSNISGRKSARFKKIEREASTKRWVERKNALIAATGEVPTESDSDNESQLSPVQKARAKSNSEKDIEKQNKRIQKALKLLETNMTEKYRINHQVVIEEERKTRSRKINVEEQEISIPTAVGLSKIPKKEKIMDDSEVDLKGKGKKDFKNNEKDLVAIKGTNSQPIMAKETEKQVSSKTEQQLKSTINENALKATKIIAPVEEIFNANENLDKKSTNVENIEQIVGAENNNVVDIIEIQNKVGNTDCLSKNKNDSFTPQLVKSEVSLGNATYVITSTLDIPDSEVPLSKTDISLKTNGFSINALCQDGRKIDLMNAVQLQRVPTNDNMSQDRNTGPDSEIQNCLNIEVEGMEVGALQRVQLGLAQFVKEEVQKRLEGPSTMHENNNRQNDFKDSYEHLDHQLKTVIETVLKNNYEAEKIKFSQFDNHQKISPEFIKAAEKSPIFQPKVMVTRLDLEKLCKTIKINNLHILEDMKRQRRVAGPLSRTVGKRRHILPKKYDGFSLSLKSNDSDSEKTMKPSTNKITIIPTPKSANSYFNTSQFSMDYTVNDSSVVNDISMVKELLLVPKEIKPLNITPIVIQKITVPTPVVNKTTKTAITKVITPRTLLPTPHTSTPTPHLTMPPTSLLTPRPTSLPPSTPSIKQNQLKLPSLTNRSSSIITLNNTTTKKPLSSKLTTPSSVNNVSQTPKRQRHICGICGLELFSKQEAEAHVKNHKIETPDVLSGVTTPLTPVVSLSQKAKPKLMRCKRCQAIVEAKHVKTHVCNSIKYNCNLCECSFGAEHLLVEHLETHTQYKRRDSVSNISKTTDKIVALKEKPVEKQPINVEHGNHIEMREPEIEDLEDILVDKDVQGYSCFVCDKVFVDEEKMKDHLQMHCEEVSDDGNEKGFQCAFCGEKFQTEESLETHVGNHLLEDGDEKINLLINMETRREKHKRFKCEQCSETFTSSLLLSMHLPIHEDDENIPDDYEKQDAEQEHHVCTICDEIFETAEELAEHLDAHNGNAHVCILCEKPFSSIRDLQEHVSTHL